MDYATACLKYPISDKIYGKSAWEYIKYLKKQLKANARNVISDLGGGQHGHLGLVLYTIEYALLSNEHYVITLYPVLLVTPKGTTHHESMCLNK